MYSRFYNRPGRDNVLLIDDCDMVVRHLARLFDKHTRPNWVLGMGTPAEAVNHLRSMDFRLPRVIVVGCGPSLPWSEALGPVREMMGRMKPTLGVGILARLRQWHPLPFGFDDGHAATRALGNLPWDAKIILHTSGNLEEAWRQVSGLPFCPGMEVAVLPRPMRGSMLLEVLNGEKKRHNMSHS